MTYSKTSPIPHKAARLAVPALCALAASLAACGGGGSDTSLPTPIAIAPAPAPAPAVAPAPAPAPASGASSTAGVLCGISGSEYNADESVNVTATYSWNCGATSRVLASNGVPNHEVGTFPGPGNPNALAAVNTAATYTMAPAIASGITQVMTTGYALNGVKMEPATVGTCDNAGTGCSQTQSTGAWSIEALGQNAFNFGTDASNGHVQPSGAYHYHGMPEAYIAKLGKGSATMTLVGWASDGFPIYARYGFSTAGDATSPVKVLQGSYRLKSAPDANRPSTAMFAMGTFTQDYAYMAGSGDLDECNGRTGVTPEFPAGIYHYVVTDSFPFIGRCAKGTPASIR